MAYNCDRGYSSRFQALTLDDIVYAIHESLHNRFNNMVSTSDDFDYPFTISTPTKDQFFDDSAVPIYDDSKVDIEDETTDQFFDESLPPIYDDSDDESAAETTQQFFNVLFIDLQQENSGVFLVQDLQNLQPRGWDLRTNPFQLEGNDMDIMCCQEAEQTRMPSLGRTDQTEHEAQIQPSLHIQVTEPPSPRTSSSDSNPEPPSLRPFDPGIATQTRDSVADPKR